MTPREPRRSRDDGSGRARPSPGRGRGTSPPPAARPDLAPRWGLVFLAVALAVHAVLLASGLLRPFSGINEDDNAVFGLGALNLARFGFLRLGFGIADGYVESVGDIGTRFYTHHPQWLIVPTAILYRLFGASDALTRLPSMLLSLVALAALYATVRTATGRVRLAALTAGAYAVLPGVVHFSSTLSEKAFVLACSSLLMLAFVRLAAQPTRGRRAVFLGALVLGGLVGWHFSFAAVAVWLAAALHRSTPGRRFVLLAVPLVSVATIAANFLHFSLLRGPEWREVFQALAQRTAPLAPALFFKRYPFWTGMDFTWAGALIALGAFLVHAVRGVRQRRFDLPLMLAIQPLLVTGVFSEWAGVHGFGPIYWAPFVALSVAQALEEGLRRPGVAPRLAAGAIAGLVLAWVPVNLAQLREPGLVLPADLETLRRLHVDGAPPARIAMGRDPRGFCTLQIAEWYMRRNAHRSVWDRDRPEYILTFHPDLGRPFARQLEQMEGAGYRRAFGERGYFIVLRRVE